MTYDLYDARGYDFPVEKRFDRLWRRAVAPGVVTITQPVEYATATPEALRAFNLLSVSDLLQEPGDRPLNGPAFTRIRRPRRARVREPERPAQERSWWAASAWFLARTRRCAP